MLRYGYILLSWDLYFGQILFLSCVMAVTWKPMALFFSHLSHKKIKETEIYGNVASE